MERYNRFKKWLELNRPKLVTAVCFLLVFILGFGTGRYDKENFSKRALYNQNQNNYNIKSLEKPKNTVTEGEKVESKVQGAVVDKTFCVVKGNISSQGKKTYHVKGGSFYDRTNPEQCFNTEAEALAAGFIKSSR